jgi:hypothetical protein
MSCFQYCCCCCCPACLPELFYAHRWCPEHLPLLRQELLLLLQARLHYAVLQLALRIAIPIATQEERPWLLHCISLQLQARHAVQQTAAPGPCHLVLVLTPVGAAACCAESIPTLLTCACA